MKIVFLSRSWHGYGGMQRLNRDLAAECEQAFGERFICVHPKATGALGFVCRAFIASVRVGLAKGQVHLSDLTLLPFGVIAHALGARVTATACGLDVTYRRAWYQVMIRWCVQSMDLIVCISHATRDEVIKRGVSADRTIVISCGMYPTDVRSAVQSDQPLLVTVGRLIQRKGVAWFVNDVLPKLSQVRYVIIGSGAEEKEIRDAIAKHQLQDRVQLITHADDAVRDAYLRQANVFVMPNVRVEGDIEGFGIACIEASVHGVPVAASRLEGIQDAVIDGVTGTFFTPHHPNECASCIQELLRQPLHPSDVARATIARFGWDAVFKDYQTHVFR